MNFKIWVCGILFLGLSVAGRAEVDGEALFKAHCKACHNLDMRLVGPALKGVTERRPEEWLLSFVKSSTTVINSGDSVANALFVEYNKVMMPDHTLSDEEILGILAYTKTGGGPKSDSGIPRPAVDLGPIYEPLSFSSYLFWIPYTVTVLAIVGLLYYLAEATSLAAENKLGTGSS